MRRKIGKRKHAALSIEKQAELQSDAALEQAVAKTANTQSRMQVRRAEALAHGRNNLANLLPVPFGKTANRRFQFRRQLNSQYPLRCRH